MLYDIRDSNKALQTLVEIIGVNSKYWCEQKDKSRNININLLDDIDSIISENNGYYSDIYDIELVLTHVMTRIKDNELIKKDYLYNLKSTYENYDSDLRMFLDSKGVYINLEKRELKYCDGIYDISYDGMNRPGDEELRKLAAWRVGRKFYYDYAIGVFLSLDPNDSYGGDVHKRPEIISDIDAMLGTNMEEDWINTHVAYEIVFRLQCDDLLHEVGGQDIINDYLVEAYKCVLMGPSTIDLTCKNNIVINSNCIIECNEFYSWD